MSFPLRPSELASPELRIRRCIPSVCHPRLDPAWNRRLAHPCDSQVLAVKQRVTFVIFCPAAAWVDIKSIVCRPSTASVFAGALLFALSFAAWGQDAGENNRKVVVKVAPEYPHLARTMNITGVVKLEALVATNGTVKSVHVKGGHPVLAEAAAAAVNRWRWERASQETTEAVEIKFIPQ